METSIPPSNQDPAAALSATNTPDGDPSALSITGNIRIVWDTNYLGNTLSVDPLAPPMRLFQVAPGASLQVDNCVLTGGVAQLGGAIFSQGAVVLYNDDFSSNTASADNNGPGLGGALYNDNGSIAMTNCAFTNNMADLAGALYQIGDGGAASTVAGNCVMTNNISLNDFVSIATNSGASSISSTLLSVQNPTSPWFGELAAAYNVPHDLAAAFPILFDPGQFQFSFNPVQPWRNGILLQVTGAGSDRVLKLDYPYDFSGGEPSQNVSLSLGNGSVSYTENFSVAVDPGFLNTPVATNFAAVVPYLGVVSIPVSAFAQTIDGTPVQAFAIDTPQYGQLLREGSSLVYSNSVPNGYGTVDSFRVVVYGGLTTTSLVTVLVAPLNQYVAYSGDSGPYTLRDTLQFVNQYYSDVGWTITLGYSDTPAVINLSTVGDSVLGPSALTIQQHVIIDGSSLNNATIRVAPGAPAMRLFHITPSGSLTLIGTTLTGGSAEPSLYGGGRGGAVFNEGSLILTNSLLEANEAQGASNSPGLGGAIYNISTLSALDSTIVSNTASDGGGIYQTADGANVYSGLTNSTLNNPESRFDITSSTANGGAASTIMVNGVVNNPSPPFIAPVDDRWVVDTNSIPFYLDAGTDPVSLCAQSDNYYVLPVAPYCNDGSQGYVHFSGTGNERQFSIDPVYDGVLNVLLEAIDGQITFGRSFQLWVTGVAVANPHVPDQYISVFSGQSLLIPVTTNDYDFANATMNITGVSQPSAGTATITNNEILYVNNGGASTNDFFSYSVTDAFGGAGSGHVFISVVQPALTVTSLEQTGPGSLGDAIAAAESTPLAVPWTILIDPSLAGQTVTLYEAYGQSYDYTAFDVTNNVRIDGSNAPGFTIAANDNEYAGYQLRPFKVEPGATLQLLNLNISGGMSFWYGTPNNPPGTMPTAGLGGAVLNEGTFYAQNVGFFNNTALGVNNGSASPGEGGAVFNDGGNATIIGSTFQGNSVLGGSSGWALSPDLLGAMGGAIFNYNGTMMLVSNIFANNSSYQGASVYNAGIGVAASLTLQSDSMTNSVGASDLASAGVDGGTSSIVSYGTNAITQVVPYISAISDLAVSNVLQLPFAFADSSGSPVLSALSSNPASLPAGDLSIATSQTNGDLTITPGPFAGDSQVTIQITDGPLSYAQVFNVALLGAPSPVSETFQATVGQPAISFNVLAGYAGTSLFFVSADDHCLKGQLVSNGDGAFTYNPGSAFNSLNVGQQGSEVFTCVVSDASNHTATFTITITINGIDLPPVAQNYTALSQPGQTILIPVSILVAGATDPDDAASTLAFGWADSFSANGVSITETNGVLVYAPGVETGAGDSFHYTIMDPEGETGTGTIEIVDVSSNLAVINPSGAPVASVVPQLPSGDSGFAVKAGSDIVIQFIGSPGQSYFVQYGEDLSNWTTVGTYVADSSGALLVRDVAPSGTDRFYRAIPTTGP